MTLPCAQPFSDQELLDWWGGDLDGLERRRVEEHLLDCASCSARLEGVSALGSGVRDLTRTGGIMAIATPQVLDRLRREGRKVREYGVPAGGGVHCTVAPEDDVVVARLLFGPDERQAPPGGRVDLLVSIDGGPEIRLTDIPEGPRAEFILMAPADELRAMPAHVQKLTLRAVGPGGERSIGEYTFSHSPWGPAPVG